MRLKFPIKNLIFESACSIKEKHVVYLQKLFEPSEVLLTLDYRASIDGWKAKDFHSKCDYKGPSLTLF
jgi:hypothetical protein